MQIIYEGKDITGVVEVHRADIMDRAGGKADSIELQLDDPAGLWSRWKPEKNHKVRLKQDGFDSGLMYVDELEQTRGVFSIRALSIPQEAKSDNSQAWEAVRFLEFATELAGRHGFSLQSYGIQNHYYERVDKTDQADFAFLADRCILEGYVLKLTDGKAVIYSEPYMEAQAAARTIHISEFDGDYRFSQTSTNIYAACEVISGQIRGAYRAPGITGPTLKITDLPVRSQGEAERFAKNLLRYRNKYEYTGRCTIPLAPGLAAGNTVQIHGVGLADGLYFCEQVTHRLASKKTALQLRRPLEGY